MGRVGQAETERVPQSQKKMALWRGFYKMWETWDAIFMVEDLKKMNFNPCSEKLLCIYSKDIYI